MTEVALKKSRYAAFAEAWSADETDMLSYLQRVATSFKEGRFQEEEKAVRLWVDCKLSRAVTVPR